MAPFYRSRTASYQSAMQCIALSCIIFAIVDV